MPSGRIMQLKASPRNTTLSILSFEKVRIANTNTSLATLPPERTNRKEKRANICKSVQDIRGSSVATAKPQRGVFVGLSMVFPITYFVQIHKAPRTKTSIFAVDRNSFKDPTIQAGSTCSTKKENVQNSDFKTPLRCIMQ